MTARLWDDGVDIPSYVGRLSARELRAAQIRARRVARAAGMELDRRMRQAVPEDGAPALADQVELPGTFVDRYLELRWPWDTAVGAASAGALDMDEALAGSADFEEFLIWCSPALHQLAAAVGRGRLDAIAEAMAALNARSAAYVSGGPPPGGTR